MLNVKWHSLMRVIVAIVNCLGFIGYASLMSFPGPGSGDGAGQARDSWVALGMTFPLVYFFTCFLTAFARARGVVLRVVGIAAHALLGLLVITIGMKASADGAAMFGVVGLFFSGLWLAMYYALPKPVAT
jgi:hypothetical protein